MKRNIQLTLIALCIASPFCFTDEVEQSPAQPKEQPSFLDMSQDEQKACGLEKLSPEERALLQQWVQKNKDTKSKSCPAPAQDILVAIKSVSQEGKMVELADGRRFAIPLVLQKTVASWKAGDMVRVEALKKKKTYSLVHTQSGKSIKVKLLSNDKDSTDTTSK